MSSTRRLERRIECGRDCGWTSAVDGIGSSTAKGVDDIVEVVEEWSQSGFVFNVFPIVYEDDPKDFIAGSFDRERRWKSIFVKKLDTRDVFYLS